MNISNSEFKNIDDFIEGFTRIGPTPEKYNYNGVIYGIEFKYKNKIYRITRDPIEIEKNLKIKFGLKKIANIKFFEIPINQYQNLL